MSDQDTLTVLHLFRYLVVIMSDQDTLTVLHLFRYLVVIMSDQDTLTVLHLFNMFERMYDYGVLNSH